MELMHNIINRSTNICSRCGIQGHYAKEHALVLLSRQEYDAMSHDNPDKRILESRQNIFVDQKPQPGDGPDYHKDLRAWESRQLKE